MWPYHLQTIKNLRSYIQTSKNPRTVAILLDTKGPEIRTGKLVGGKDIKLTAGSLFTFHNDSSRLGDATQAYTTYTELAASVQVGDRVLVDDGLIGTRVVEVREELSE
ncbi:hypothetical protein HDU82_007143, partial [Entophlyctis luteolus]